MKIKITELFKVVTPDEGKMLYDPSDNTYTDLVYSPLDSDPESYWQEVNIEDIPEEPQEEIFPEPEFPDIEIPIE